MHTIALPLKGLGSPTHFAHLRKRVKSEKEEITQYENYIVYNAHRLK